MMAINNGLHSKYLCISPAVTTYMYSTVGNLNFIVHVASLKNPFSKKCVNAYCVCACVCMENFIAKFTTAYSKLLNMDLTLVCSGFIC